jgi:hypothetical protein
MTARHGSLYPPDKRRRSGRLERPVTPVPSNRSPCPVTVISLTVFDAGRRRSCRPGSAVRSTRGWPSCRAIDDGVPGPAEAPQWRTATVSCSRELYGRGSLTRLATRGNFSRKRERWTVGELAVHLSAIHATRKSISCRTGAADFSAAKPSLIAFSVMRPEIR